MLNIKIVTLSLGIFIAISFILCVVYGLIVPETLHMHQFLQNVLPGFQWFSPGAFFLGLIESFLWGIYAGIVYVPLYNFIYKRLNTGKTT